MRERSRRSARLVADNYFMELTTVLFKHEDPTIRFGIINRLDALKEISRRMDWRTLKMQCDKIICEEMGLTDRRLP